MYVSLIIITSSYKQIIEGNISLHEFYSSNKEIGNNFPNHYIYVLVYRKYKAKPT